MIGALWERLRRVEQEMDVAMLRGSARRSVLVDWTRRLREIADEIEEKTNDRSSKED